MNLLSRICWWLVLNFMLSFAPVDALMQVLVMLLREGSSRKEEEQPLFFIVEENDKPICIILEGSD